MHILDLPASLDPLNLGALDAEQVEMGNELRLLIEQINSTMVAEVADEGCASFDVEGLGPVFLLGSFLDEDTCEVVQPIWFMCPPDVEPKRLFHYLRMARLDFMNPPNVTEGVGKNYTFAIRYHPNDDLYGVIRVIQPLLKKLVQRIEARRVVPVAANTAHDSYVGSYDGPSSR